MSCGLQHPLACCIDGIVESFAHIMSVLQAQNYGSSIIKAGLFAHSR
jgi:hypothetical protein